MKTEFPPSNGSSFISWEEGDYVRRRVESSEFELLRKRREVKFIGTYIGDLKHYNEKYKEKI